VAGAAGRRLLRGRGRAHPADVLELPGAHVVGVHDEALVVGLQQVTELGVILRAHGESRRELAATLHGSSRICSSTQLQQTAAVDAHLLLLAELAGGRHGGCEAASLRAGPDRLLDRKGNFNLLSSLAVRPAAVFLLWTGRFAEGLMPSSASAVNFQLAQEASR